MSAMGRKLDVTHSAVKPRRRAGAACAMLVAVGLAGAARANDTLAVLGAGGLEIARSDHIAMLSEDLYLSAAEIRVRYAFRNDSDRDITATVAFPLPELDQGPAVNVDLPVPGRQNFVDFKVTVDGREVQPILEERAIGPDGADVTARLAKAGVPLNANLPGWQEKVRALPDEAWRELVRAGLFAAGPDEPRSADEAFPTWRYKATFHWEQTFPAGAAIQVDHRYRPVVGATLFYEDRQLATQYAAYCLDAPGRAGASRLLKQAKAARPAGERDAVVLPAREVSYVLTTGANWKGPIGDFHLTIDKGDPKAVLSLCLSGLQKTGPTTFELRQADFVPREDIRFLLFDPAR